MVTVIDYAIRENSEKKTYVALQLQGSLELVLSQKTGQYYATTRTCWISSTFSEDIAKGLVGSELSGKVMRQECPIYEYTVAETGELILLQHKWVYEPDEATKPVEQVEVQPIEASKSEVVKPAEVKQVEPSVNGMEELV